jgi:hypothetical protein
MPLLHCGIGMTSMAKVSVLTKNDEIARKKEILIA